jgi:hypothetical protein
VAILLADRFEGTSPLYWEDVDADRRQRLLSMLGVEGEVAHAWAGLGPDDDVVLVDPDKSGAPLREALPGVIRRDGIQTVDVHRERLTQGSGLTNDAEEVITLLRFDSSPDWCAERDVKRLGDVRVPRRLRNQNDRGVPVLLRDTRRGADELNILATIENRVTRELAWVDWLRLVSVGGVDRGCEGGGHWRLGCLAAHVRRNEIRQWADQDEARQRQGTRGNEQFEHVGQTIASPRKESVSAR